jgi:hypothetical protein
MVVSPTASLLGCKFYHAPPFYVVDYSGQIYDVVHRLQSIFRGSIHLGVHKHLVVSAKCKEFMDKTIRLIIKDVDRTPNVKIFTITLSASKTFLVKHLLDDNGDDMVEFIDGEQLEHI